MRVLGAQVSNFASYKELTIDFTDKGLTLISGPTGSGKSTLCDIIPWVLFGKTAKDGAADEIRPWNTEGPTTGVLYVQHNNQEIQIVRSRKPNDLYYSITEPIRGKDQPDTQRLINALFGISYETYLAGAYLHEFSQTAGFFTAPAKVRRQILEQVVDLSLPKILAEKLKIQLKDTSERLDAIERSCQLLQVQRTETCLQRKKELCRAEAWQAEHVSRISEMKRKADNFDADKTSKIKELRAKFLLKKVELEVDIEALRAEIKPDTEFLAKIEGMKHKLAALGDAKCDVCGSATSSDERLSLTKRLHDLQREHQTNDNLKVQLQSLQVRLKAQTDSFETAVKSEEAKNNVYLEQLSLIKDETNKHTQWAADLEVQENALAQKIQGIQNQIDTGLVERADYELLQEVIEDFRALLVKNTILQLEDLTNRRLSDYFDAEIRVQFEIADKDRVDVQIYKDGNSCSYTQLSKGQRGMLKLCFGTAVMKTVQEHNSVTFNTVFLDEALDGLDDRFKTQSFGLLQELAADHESVFVVEHNENLKTMFPSRLNVDLSNGTSALS